MNLVLPQLPVLHEGDSFIVDLEMVSIKKIRVIRIMRFRHNQNSEGVKENILDLDQQTRKAVIHQINQQYPGRTILVK